VSTIQKQINLSFTSIYWPYSNMDLPVEVGRAPDGYQAVGAGELGKHPDLVIVFKTGTHHCHFCSCFAEKNEPSENVTTET
jgi:hypothetical protein